jgi:hypothetical protein
VHAADTAAQEASAEWTRFVAEALHNNPNTPLVWVATGDYPLEHHEQDRPPYLRPDPGPGPSAWKKHTVLLYKASLKFNDMALDLWEKLLLNACEGHYRAALLEVRAWRLP